MRIFITRALELKSSSEWFQEKDGEFILGFFFHPFSRACVLEE
jgi:hypothetical protein